MPLQILRRLLALLVGIAVFSCSGWVAADPPSRVARLGYVAGSVSFSPAGENDWVKATINRPLGNGDRLWTDANGRARAEIQVGGAMIRMAEGTSLSVLNLDDRIAQLQVTQGTLNVRVLRLDADQVFEVDTPNLAFTLRQPGEYRIDVDPDGDATSIVVRQGKGEAYGEDAAYLIDGRQAYRFTGTGLRDYQLLGEPRLDDFDRWASNRDRAYDNSRSARYVSSEVVGYQDLDSNGSWRVDASYGNVWIPNHVAVDWAPYSDGHWAWVDPWGWTWIDDAPWGFAVSHYGRWANLGGTWGWVPGPLGVRAYYAPALVVFVGGNNFQLQISSGTIGAVAWFPLGPREVYRPSYPVSRRYFENVNISNTVINNTTIINNQYDTTNVTKVIYANQQVAGAVVAVPTTAFAQSQRVSRGAQRISGEALAGQPLSIAPPVVPTEKSVRGASAPGDKPPPRVFERPVIARTPVPAASAGFAAQREQLSSKPGRPLDADSRKALKPEAAVPTPAVKMLAPRPEGPQVPRPPAAAGVDGRRGPSDQRNKESAAPATTPAAPTAPDAREKTNPEGRRERPGAATQPKPEVVVPSPGTRDKSEADSKREPRAPPAAPPESPAAGSLPGPAPRAVQAPEPRDRMAQPARPAAADIGQRQPKQPEPPAPPRERHRGNADQEASGEPRAAPSPNLAEPRAQPPRPPSALPSAAEPPAPAAERRNERKRGRGEAGREDDVERPGK